MVPIMYYHLIWILKSIPNKLSQSSRISAFKTMNNGSMPPSKHCCPKILNNILPRYPTDIIITPLYEWLE